MGKPIAVNMVKAGLDVTVVNRSQEKVREIAEMGAVAGTTPAAAAANADVVVLCLSGEETIDRVLSGDNGVFETARPRTVVLDHSTVHPDDARRFERECAEHGLIYLDAPVSGTGQVAADGRLTIMVGGDAGAFGQVKPELDAVSAHAFHLGPVGSGNLAKLMNNMIADAYQIAIMEGFVLAAKLGMDVGALFEVLRTSSATSRQLERIGPKILDRDFQQTSSLGGHVRGQEIMGSLAERVGVRLPLRETVEQFWRRGVDAGLGPGDPVKGVMLLEQDAGIEVHR
jgi:3-hydroxyisobutyrate dehydrogenase-like beta-hydroxyacid dehydrogenase